VFRFDQHLPDGIELVFFQQAGWQQVRGKLYGNLTDYGRYAIALLPDMFQPFSGNQNKIIVFNIFDAIPYGSFQSFSVFNEIDLEFPVLVEGKGEFRFITFYNVKTVLVRQGRDLVQDA
jgi:hypothetical protein